MTHEYDFIETVRAWLFPKLHATLVKLGLYSKGYVDEKQYVGTFYAGEEALEATLLHEPHQWQRNPLAAFKEHRDGRESTLSLRLTHGGSEDYKRTYVEEGMQLHVTLLPSAHANDGAVDIYAHYEDDWAVSPIAHLESKNFSPSEGVKRMRAFLRHATTYKLDEDWKIETYD